MDLFGVLTMIGGLALFLYGMHLMGDGLSKASGGRLEKILEKLTSNPIKAVLLGAAVTAIIQSSSATTVMVVGFVNSGVMKLSQTIGIIMGANIGTTITSWILSLTGIESGNFFIQLLKPTSFSPVLAIIGVGFLLFSKKESKKNIGMIMVGFAILMFGMDTMSNAVKPLADVPEFTGILTAFSQPVLGMLAGLVLTAIIQSSSASVGILQALCVTGSVTFGTAIPIIMGQNIGTCVTAMLSGIGASKNAKRAALVHLYFNIIGTVVFMVVFYTANSFVHFAFLEDAATAAGIAVVHSIFNVCATLALLPFSRVLERLACLTIPEDTEETELLSAGEKDFKLLDIRFLDTPGFAVQQCRQVSEHMADLTREALFTAIELVDKYDEKKAERVVFLENEIDHYEDQLGTYLVKLGQKQVSEKDNHTLSIILHCLSDFERISDHAVSVKKAAEEMHTKGLSFSKKAAEELEVYTQAIKDTVDVAFKVFKEEDDTNAIQVELLEEVVDYLKAELKQRHVKRLQKGKCTIEMGFVHSDIITSYERVTDHCSNIVVCIKEVAEDNLAPHGYLEEMKEKDREGFKKKYKELKKRYVLP
ncbi:MAG: Na/Pi cotransporter family protein [Lachnospiraceae bacterium]|nr:Na/Pi cotransporter family protein [Lachnospiraceae bacterium]MDD7027431.1 Na/Pi cotransporter family protein [Lachnospiraceae bacterium]MDY5700005.1 Na/Pi cotransporter family protein [Lachnospiraceae bacterium]